MKTNRPELKKMAARDYEDMLGFVDPRDVLRGCHIPPASSQGRRQADGVDVSPCANGGEDCHSYYVGRCVQT